MGNVIKLSGYKKNKVNSDSMLLYKFKQLSQEFNVENCYKKCCICKWDKGDIYFLMVRPKERGGRYSFDNILPLCSNHNLQLVSNQIDNEYVPFIQEFLWTVCNEITLI